MSMRREAVLWSMAIAAAAALGLGVVWAAIRLSLGRPALAPLDFAVARYRLADYSAGGVEAPRLNPLDPRLEEEAIVEDLARASLAPDVNDMTLGPEAPLSPAAPPLNLCGVRTVTPLPGNDNPVPSVIPPASSTFQTSPTPTANTEST